MYVVIFSLLTVMVVGMPSLPGNYKESLLCRKCDASKCPVARNCKDGLALDPCGCCKVCVRSEGEVCGGLGSLHGVCKEGLTCQIRHPSSISNKLLPPWAKQGRCEPDACKAVKCGMHQWCTVKDNTTECICPVHCKDRDDPVCGLADGQNYKNPCVVRKRECKLQERIGWLPGKCKNSPVITWKALIESRNDGSFPCMRAIPCEGTSTTKVHPYVVKVHLHVEPDVESAERCRHSASMHWEGCTTDGQEYKYGEVIPGRGPCQTCECRHGNWICQVDVPCLRRTLYKGYNCTGYTPLHKKIECPDGFTCVIGKPGDNETGILDLGNCVPLEPEQCTLDGKKYSPGEQFIDANCTGYCRCGSRGAVGCVSLCPPVTAQCKHDQKVVYVDEPVSSEPRCSCSRPRCVDEPDFCTIGGKKYKVGERFIDENCTGYCRCNGSRGFSCVSLCPPSLVLCGPGEVMAYYDEPLKIEPRCSCARPKCVNVERTCTLDFEAGPCYAYFERWYFNSKSGRCEMFVYGGCQGNENNFKTKVGCEKVCLNKQVVPKIPSTPKPEVPEIPDEIKGKESNVTEAPEIIPPTGTLFSGSEPEDKWTWPDPGPREDIKMSDKNMTISGSIKFNKSPKKLPKLSCLRVKFEDHSIADGSAYVFAEKKIDMSEVDVSDKPLTYSLVSKMPHKTELWRDVSMVAVLNVGWCRTGPTPKWIRNRDYLTDTSIPISLEETKHDYSVDIPMVYYCVGPDCQDKVVKPAKLQEPSENFSAEDDTPETQVKPEKPSNKSEVLPTSPPIPPPNCTDLKGNDHDIDDEWEQDDCTTCRCTPLGIICNTVSCRAPCLNPVKVPGKCCPVCPPEPKRCVDDETGKKYKVGESWFGSDDCKKCTCLSGGMPVCSTPMCALPYCPLSRPVKIKGRCCPVCPKDKFCTDETDGRAYKMGLERWQRDTCEVCRCTKDGVVCVDPSRANKTCDYPQSYNMNCNPICIDDLVPPPGPMPVRPIGCLDNTNMGRPLGSIWHPDKCTTCTCTGKEYGQVSCTVVDCPPLKDCEEVTNLPRRCCPICKKYTNKTCEYKEKKYYNEDVVSLDDRCSVCTCKSGQWVCDRSYCEKKDKVCKYKGKIYKAGDLVMQDCNTCICGKRGGFACTEISCPPDLPKPLPKVSDPPPTAEEP